MFEKPGGSRGLRSGVLMLVVLGVTTTRASEPCASQQGTSKTGKPDPKPADPARKAPGYFVYPTGDDQRSGKTAAESLRWIQTAINRAQPGDTLYLLPGVHGVRPGDKNITFAGKRGTPEAPITLTAASPGAVIDLSGANPDWGGLRVSDRSAWIVVDGGGAPCPFDESSYWLTATNAAYDAARGNGRSFVSCRPITIQDASNVTVRNFFGKHSMGGAGIFGKGTRDVLLENCRFVPGDRKFDPGVSHGIYVGSGADKVTVRNTFVQWGGGGRLGLQNNGGGRDVTMERSCVTECERPIKSVAGGNVTVKQCWFWDNREANTGQGQVTAPAGEIVASQPEAKPGRCRCGAAAHSTPPGTGKPPTNTKS